MLITFDQETLQKKQKRLETKRRAIQNEIHIKNDIFRAHKLGAMDGKIQLIKEILDNSVKVNVN